MEGNKRVKVTHTIDREFLLKVKHKAVDEGKNVSGIIEEALLKYFN